MGNKIVVKLNSPGIRQLLRSDEFLAVVTEKAQEMATRAGDGFEVSPYVGAGRVNASVYAVTKKASEEVYSSNALLKSLR